MRTASGSPDPRGFALLEVLITAGIVVAVAAGASQIVAIAIRAGHAARVRTMATMLAAQKMEQLRSLAWTHITAGSPPASVFSLSSSDATTDLSSDPATDAGPGLLPSPGGTLGANVPYYVDYLDGDGRWLGRGASPPGSAAYVRRWAVQPLAADPDNILVFHVLVTTRGAPGAVSSDAARLVTIEARK
jgi:type II secretory pathway pseudopilin PulG